MHTCTLARLPLGSPRTARIRWEVQLPPRSLVRLPFVSATIISQRHAQPRLQYEIVASPALPKNRRQVHYQALVVTTEELLDCWTAGLLDCRSVGYEDGWD